MTALCPAIAAALAAEGRASDAGPSGDGEARGTRSGRARAADGAEFAYRLRVCVPAAVAAAEPADLAALLALVELLVRWVASLRWSAGVRELLVDLDLTGFKKEWCWRDGEDITPCNINSGETELDGSGYRAVHVWRREDFHKVLLHELLHAFNWDRLVPRTAGRGLESEAAVEAVALLLHCRLLAPNRGAGGLAGALALLGEERVWTAGLARLLARAPGAGERTNVAQYVTLRAALTLTDPLLARFAAWLALDSVRACRDAWRALADAGLRELPLAVAQMPAPSGAPDAAPGCASLALVRTQLALAPRPKRRARLVSNTARVAPLARALSAVGG